MKQRLAMLALILVLSLMGTIACHTPSSQDDVLAEVGGVVITVDDLLDHPAATQALDSIIQDTLVLIECQERGIKLDEVKYRESVDSFVNSRGGKEEVEAFMRQNNIWWPDFFQFNRLQVLSAQLVEALAGEPTEKEMRAHFDENLDRIRRTVARRMGVEEGQVTFLDALEDVKMELINQKQGEIWQTFKADLEEKYGVKNYISGAGVRDEEEDEPEVLLDLSGEEEEEGIEDLDEEHGEDGDDDETGEEDDVETGAEEETSGH